MWGFYVGVNGLMVELGALAEERWAWMFPTACGKMLKNMYLTEKN